MTSWLRGGDLAPTLRRGWGDRCLLQEEAMTNTINEYRAGLKVGSRSEFLAIGDVIPGHEEELRRT
jgi:hypothetical protein